MEHFFSVVFWPIATSIVGGLLVVYYLNYRKEKLRKKIESLSQEEAFLEKLAKGNIKLLRTTFIAILLSIVLGFTAAIILIAGHALQLSNNVLQYFYWLAAWLLALAVGVCSMHIRSISSLSDLSKTKEKIHTRKQKLESKLENT